MKKISVIIPCYNVSLYIDRCMTSVMNQTMGTDSLEIICIDDASTDDTWEKLKKWEQLFPNDMILLHQEVNRRQGAARNMGLEYASADWISFVDADDWLDLDYFERLYEPVSRYSCDVVCCRFAREVTQTKGINQSTGKCINGRYITVDTEEIKQVLLRKKILGPGACAKIIRKNLLTKYKILFPEELVYEDHYWIPLLHIYAEKIYVMENELYHYFWNPESTVLSRNREHHLDQLTIQLIKWEDYDKRGLLQEYRQCLEYDFLWYAVTSFLKTIILFWDEPPYSYFRLGQEIIRQQIPDYRKNPYIEELSDINRWLLELLYTSVNKEEFHELAGRIKNLL